MGREGAIHKVNPSPPTDLCVTRQCYLPTKY